MPDAKISNFCELAKILPLFTAPEISALFVTAIPEAKVLATIEFDEISPLF